MDKVNIVRSQRRTVSMQIMADATILVKAPIRFPENEIKKFLLKNQEWIKQKQIAMLTRTAQKKADEYLYLGKKYLLEIRSQKNLIEVEDKIYLGIKTNNTKTYLTNWYKTEANKIIGERVKHYANISGLSYKSIAITSAETRWGSCSSQKTLNFNWRLIMAPIEVIDYVITHELAHLTEMNHSLDFWETVRKMYPLYRQHRTWLKRYGELLRV